MRLNSPSVRLSICACFHASIYPVGVCQVLCQPLRMDVLVRRQAWTLLKECTFWHNPPNCRLEGRADPAPAGRAVREDQGRGAELRELRTCRGHARRAWHAQRPRGRMGCGSRPFRQWGSALRVSEKLWTFSRGRGRGGHVHPSFMPCFWRTLHSPMHRTSDGRVVFHTGRPSLV